MSLPCEIAVKCLLPPVRAMIAKELITKHNLKQAQSAKILGVSQPAISLYIGKNRGKAIDLEKDLEIKKLVENMANLLIENKLSTTQFIENFCEICKAIRAKGLMCQLHEVFDPSIDIEKCKLCKATNALKCI
jgi:predicted transcriptional regulator